MAKNMAEKNSKKLQKTKAQKLEASKTKAQQAKAHKPKKEKGKKKSSKAKVLNAREAEELFSRVDETGHIDSSMAQKEKKRRAKKGVGLKIDPLSGKDPSGSNVGTVIAKTAVAFVVIILVTITVLQVGCGAVRRFTTANLSTNVTVESVASALRGGVEWGSGFTQFPDAFTVQEADENTGRIDVTVVDTTAENELDAMAGSYIQATAFSTNALLNPKINTVIYRVNVHTDGSDQIEHSQFFGFLLPTGPIKHFMTFIFTKVTTANGGFNIVCTITGLDEETTQKLRDKISSPLPFVNSNSDNDSVNNTLPGDGTAPAGGTAAGSGKDTSSASASNGANAATATSAGLAPSAPTTNTGAIS